MNTSRLDQMRDIADDYTRHKDSPDARADLIDLLGAEVLSAHDVRKICSLADAVELLTAEPLRTEDLDSIRTAAVAARAAIPRVILAEAERGKGPRQIAAELGLSPAEVNDALHANAHRATTRPE